MAKAKATTSKRSPEKQRLHDLVIAALAERYTARGYVVHTNPNQQKNQAVGGRYPDVVVMRKASKRPRLVVEVETEESVSSAEAGRQWAEYDSRYEAWLLAVPVRARASAKALIAAHALTNVRLVTWAIDFAGLRR